MLKRVLTSILLLLSTILFGCPASATANYVAISCPETAPVGTPTTCSVTGHSTSSISSISLNISANNLQVLKISPDSTWKSSVNNGQIIVNTDVNRTGDFNIATIDIQPSSVGVKGLINLSNITFSNDNFFSFSVANISTSITSKAADPQPSKETPSTDASALKSLEIKNHNIDFSSEKYTYSLHIPENTSSLDITATPADPAATVSITGNENLTNDSVIKITVENGEQKSIYRIKINTDTITTTVTDTPSNNAVVIIIICSLVILATSACAFFLFHKKNNPKKPTKKPPVYKTPARPSGANPFANTPPIDPFSIRLSQKPEEPPVQPSPTPQPAPTPKPTPIELPPIPQSARPISLDEIPFEQQPTSPQIKKPTTPIIFES